MYSKNYPLNQYQLDTKNTSRDIATKEKSNFDVVYFFILLFLILINTASSSNAQPTKDSNRFIPLGPIFPSAYIEKIEKDTNGITFIVLHDNEYTAQQALKHVLNDSSGTGIFLHNKGDRNLAAYFNGRKIEIDPNRIFHSWLQDTSNHAKASGIDSIRAYLARELLKVIQKAKLVVSLHNNTPNGLTIHSYKKKTIVTKLDSNVYINPLWSGDDFIITTDSVQFRYFQSLNMNCILQDKDKINMDGSLSEYMQKKKQPFISIECQYGHLPRQIQIIMAVYQYYYYYYVLP